MILDEGQESAGARSRGRLRSDGRAMQFSAKRTAGLTLECREVVCLVLKVSI